MKSRSTAMLPSIGKAVPRSKPADMASVCALAAFRYHLRKFLRFSEQAAREHGVTPQQHQLMLGIAGYTGRGCATLSELAEFLQERHNSVVGLVERAAQQGLVRKTQAAEDRRKVVVALTRHGESMLSKLTALHQEELLRVQAWLLQPVKATLPHKKTSKKTGKL